MMNSKKERQSLELNLLLIETEKRKRAAERQRIKTLCEDSLYEFVKYHWSIIESTKLVEDKYLQLICKHLEAVQKGKLLRLIVNAPPRSLKSEIGLVFFPAWVWALTPEKDLLTGSNAARNAVRDSVRSRDILASARYQRLWGDKVELKSDHNLKTSYNNILGGSRQIFSTGGNALGLDGDIILYDDPTSEESVYSKKQSESDYGFFTGTLRNRLNDPKKSAIVIFQQRLGAEDTSGKLLKKGGWTHLNLPMELDKKNRCVTKWGKDPRTRDKQILTKRHNKETLAALRKDIGSRKYETQYLQRPSVAGGEIFVRENWRYYRELPDLNYLAAGWDTACKTGQHNDYTVGITGGYTDNAFYFIDMFREKVKFPELERVIKASADKHNPYEIGIEDASSGIQVNQTLLEDTRLPIIPVKVAKTGLVPVAHSFTPRLEAGKFYLPENAPWLYDFIEEMSAFPNAPHDDIVSAFLVLMRILTGGAYNLGALTN